MRHSALANTPVTVIQTFAGSHHIGNTLSVPTITWHLAEIWLIMWKLFFNLCLDEVIWMWLQKLKTSKYFKESIFNALLFADEQFIICDTEDNLKKAIRLLYNISKEYNLEIATKKTKVFGFVGTDHLRTKNIINDETLEKLANLLI